MYVFTVFYSLIGSVFMGMWLENTRAQDKKQRKEQVKQINESYWNAYGDHGPGWHR